MHFPHLNWCRLHFIANWNIFNNYDYKSYPKYNKVSGALRTNSLYLLLWKSFVTWLLKQVFLSSTSLLRTFILDSQLIYITKNIGVYLHILASSQAPATSQSSWELLLLGCLEVIILLLAVILLYSF